jgi:hypothetical protein
MSDVASICHKLMVGLGFEGGYVAQVSLDLLLHASDLPPVTFAGRRHRFGHRSHHGFKVRYLPRDQHQLHASPSAFG